MNAEILDLQHLERQRAHYATMTAHFADIIKQLTGYVPDDFVFTFTIKDIPIVSIPITTEDSNFCLGLFMAWHQYYSRQLREATTLYNSMVAKVA